MDVTLLGSAEACLRAPHIRTVEYTDTRDLMARMRSWVEAHPNGAVVHASAVGDYESRAASAHKIPSGSELITLTLTRAPKIADHVRGWGLVGPYVTFKAASPQTTLVEMVEIMRAQRDRVACDFVFGNVLGALGTTATLLGEDAVHFPNREAAINALVERVKSTLMTERQS